ncbi:MAG TPA: Hpt domain-containing protein [Oligoflexus sp.]|uniref:Hpt domain-containing protein n=1 Tax=Oligoflexus sp. TaxID=1971216 RepID=UPI002D7F5799|nr:Hpt domain-containing protein [Oligoflexus sp.]HET9240942.1 Hpt domain-containing protein [Oligoflexus sp.]
MIVEVDKELEDVFPRYLRNREEDMMKIQTALEKKDFEFLRQIGHKLAGNAAGYGLLELGEMARDLERSAEGRQYDKCRLLFSHMKDYLAELELKFV